MAAMITVKPTSERISIILRPKRSASLPKSGASRPDMAGSTEAKRPDQRASPPASETPRDAPLAGATHLAHVEGQEGREEREADEGDEHGERERPDVALPARRPRIQRGQGDTARAILRLTHRAARALMHGP